MAIFDNVRILVVDDEELLREVLVETFTMHGALVDSASGGNQAFEKIRNGRYDVVFSDVRMPDGDGISLMSRIKTLNRPEIKLFVYSAYNDLSAARIAELNILKVFNKPFEIGGLVEGVSKFL